MTITQKETDLKTTQSAHIALKMNLDLLEWRLPLNGRLGMQKEMHLRDLACCSVDSNYREAHLKNPTVHDFFDT